MAKKVTFQKRTTIVLTSLLAAMTLGAGLLLALEPSPMVPSAEARLLSTQTTSDPEAVLFNTNPAQPWAAIVIHDSATLDGSLATVQERDRRMGLDGLGYHFVVNRDQGAAARRGGMIEMGYRWKHQLAGQHSDGPYAAWFNQSAIGICMIGDTTRNVPGDKQIHELLWLVRQLQTRFDIPADRVYIQTGQAASRQGRIADDFFPAATFRQQLMAMPSR